MSKENDMKEELLKQMDKKSNKTSGANMKSAQEIIARDMARVKRMKWVTILSWLLVAICFIVIWIAKESQWYTFESRWWLGAAVMILRALLLVAIIFTISLYVRSRTLSMRQIQARLSNIESLLKRMSEGQ